jgi:nitrogen fixation NifU-like protein
MKITNKEIAQELSLPPVKIHCSVLAEDAIKAAIEDFRAKRAARATGTAPSAEITKEA